MDNLTTTERLDNLESGIVKVSQELYRVPTDPEIDDVMEELRLRLNKLHKRLQTLGQTTETAYSILLKPEDQNV